MRPVTARHTPLAAAALALAVLAIAPASHALVDESLALRTAGVPYRWDGKVFRVPLTIRDNSGVDRRAWPVTSGVPLPRGVVKDVASLRLTDTRGREIPCQFTPLSRHWALDGSVRWVLLDFQVDVPANGSVTVWLSNDGPARAEPPPLRLAETAGAVEVDTGAMKVRIPRRTGAVIGEVRLGARTVLRGGEGDGPFIRSAAVPFYERFRGPRWNPAGWHKLRTRAKRRLAEALYRAGPPRRVEVERRGPLHVIVKLHGTHLPARRGAGILEEGLYNWTTRLHFYAGKPWILVQHDIENSSRRRPQWVHPFREAGLAWRLAGGGPYEVAAGGLDAAGGLPAAARLALRPGQRALLRQAAGRKPRGRRARPIPGGYVFGLAGDGGRLTAPRARGGRARWLAAGDDGASVVIAMRYLWEQAPRAIAADGEGQLRILVHADGRAGNPDARPYDLDLGERSIHDVLLAFHGGPPDARRAAALAEGFEYPLFAHAPPAWYSHTEAWYFEVSPEPARPGRKENGTDHWWPAKVGYRRHAARRSYNSGGHHESLNSAWLRFIRTGSLTELEKQRAISRWAVAHNPGWHYEGNRLTLPSQSEADLRALDRQIAEWGRLAGFGPKDFHLWRSGRTRTVRRGGRTREEPEGGWSYLNGYKVLPDHEHYAFFRLFEYWYLTGEPRALDAIHGFVNWAVYYQHHHLFRGRTRPLSDVTLFDRDPEALWRGHYARVYTWMLYTTLAGFHATGSPVFDLYARWQLRRMLRVLRHRHGQLTRIGNRRNRRGERDPATGRTVWFSRAKTWMEAQGVMALHEAWKTWRDPLILDGLWAQADYFAHHVVFYPRLAMINQHTAMPNAWLGSARWTLSPQRHDRVIQALPLLAHYAPWPGLLERQRAFAEATRWRWVRDWFLQTLAWAGRVRPSSAPAPPRVRDLRARIENGTLVLSWRQEPAAPVRWLVRAAGRPIVARAPTDHPGRARAKAEAARAVEARAIARLGLDKARKRFPGRFPLDGIAEPRRGRRAHPDWFRAVPFWAAAQAPVEAAGRAAVPIAAFRRHEALGAPGAPPPGIPRHVCLQAVPPTPPFLHCAPVAGP